MSKLNYFVKVMISITSILIVGCGNDMNFSTIVEPVTSILSGKVQATYYQQAEGGKVDILIVVDNSASMYDEQAKIGSRFGDFIGDLNNTDWQISFINTDMTTATGESGWGGRFYNLQGASGNVLTANTPDAQGVFLNTIDRSAEEANCSDSNSATPCATTDEEPLRAIKSAVSLNRSFFRSDASLAIVVLTDEDELSLGEADATTAESVVNHIKSELGNYKNFSSYGMIVQPGDTSCYDDQTWSGGEYGDYIQNLADLTNGLTSSICSTDYSSALRDISGKIKKNLLIKDILLEDDVKAGTLEVTITPATDVKWVLEGRRIIFESYPPEGSKIDISFDRKGHDDEDEHETEEDDHDDDKDKKEK